MKKKLLSILLSVAMIAAMLVGCGGSSSTPAETDATEKSTEPAASTESSGEKIRIGALSVLNITEDQYSDINLAWVKAMEILKVDNVASKNIKRETIFFDNLDAMQMALEAGDIDYMGLPKCTADYLVANNDKMEIPDIPIMDSLEKEKLDVLNPLFDTNFAFMMRGDSKELRDDFDDALDDMKEDGTLDNLIKEYITDVVDGKEPKAVEFEGNGNETINVAVTGDLPPMDYVAADGSFAGFNTAILAEIGKRLGKKIELKQVDSAARAISLSSNEVDVVFWTRVPTEISDEDDGKSKEVKEALMESDTWMQRDKMDIPEGTIVTEPYYGDRLVRVGLKK